MESGERGIALGTPSGSRRRWESALASKLIPFLTTALAALIILVVFTGGIRRGMDHVVAYGPQSEQNAIAIAISEIVYGLDGYVGYASVVDSLTKVMNRGADGPNDPKIVPNLSNGELINEAIANAISLGPQPPGFVAQGSLITMVYDDIGIIDFDKAAFLLFGYSIQSLYYFFFAILSLSAAAFLLQFWNKPTAQILLLCNLFAFYLETHTAIFTSDMPSFWGMRHGSTLAILPTWHLVLLLAYRVRMSLVALALALTQVVILVLAIKMRGSAVWTVLFLAVLTAFFVFQAWRQLPSAERSAMKFVRLLCEVCSLLSRVRADRYCKKILTL